MTPTLSPYPTYKPSGVEWLGDVPEHWEVPRLKDVGYLKSGAGFPHSYQGNPSAEFPFFKVGDMAVSGNERLMQVWKHTVSSDTVNILGAHVFLPNTIVFAKVGAALLLNRRRVLTRPSCIDNNMMGFLARGHSTEWMCHWLSTVDFRMVVNPGAVPSVNERQLEVLPVLVPPLPEQAAIVRYLDHVDRRIRRYVSAKRKLIALLEEEKQAVINQAVTRGLDPNVRLKPSGVEWLGDVPAHWEVRKVSQIFSIGSGTTPPTDQPEYYGGQIPWVTTSELRESVLTSTKKTVTREALRAFPTLRIYPTGSIAVAMYGATIGRLGILGTPATVNQACCVFSDSKGMEPRFWFYWLQSRRHHLVAMGYGGGQPNLSQELLRALRVPTPSLDEQLAIVEHLDEATAHIDARIDRPRRQIELIQEYRTRLVADVVTGKLDVREVAAQLPDEGGDQDPIEENGLLADGIDGDLSDADASAEELALESDVTA